MPYKPGFEEDGFLKSLAPFEPKEIELKAKNCTEASINSCSNIVISDSSNKLLNI
jgi:hypothetical protein